MTESAALPFHIDVTPTGVTITDDAHPENTLTVANIDALLHLAWQCHQAACASDERITSHQAVARAGARGIRLDANAIGTACRRRYMPGARRQGGRWTIPLWAFETWLAAYVRRGQREG
jgi:hypothetical protein